MAKTFFDNSMSNFTRWLYTSHFTDEVTAECLLLTITVVKDSLDNWAGGSSLRMVLEADIYRRMQNPV